MCTKEQLSVILNSVPEQWITGPAGSGKTWLLMKKVVMLAQKALLQGTKEKNTCGLLQQAIVHDVCQSV